MLRLFLDAGDHGVVVAIGPADVDSGEDPAGEDDADAERDAERHVAGDFGREDVALEGDQEDEAVVEDQRHRGELKGEAVLAAGGILELPVLKEMQGSVGGGTHEARLLPQRVRPDGVTWT